MLPSYLTLQFLALISAIVCTTPNTVSSLLTTTLGITVTTPLQSGTFEYDECLGSFALCTIHASQDDWACIRDACLGIETMSSRRGCSYTSLSSSAPSTSKSPPEDVAIETVYPDRTGTAAIASKVIKASSKDSAIAAATISKESVNHGGRVMQTATMSVVTFLGILILL